MDLFVMHIRKCKFGSYLRCLWSTKNIKNNLKTEINT